MIVDFFEGLANSTFVLALSKAIFIHFKLFIMKIFKTNAILLAILFAGLTSFAKTNNDNKPFVEINLVGTIQEHTVFQLTLNSEVMDLYTIRITDAKGNFMYKEELKGKGVNRKYAFAEDEAIETPVRVEVTSKSTGKTEVYEVTWVITKTENYVVTKLK